MSATPLMSEFPVEKKANDAYPVVEEPDVELVVGSEPVRRRCFWSRFRGCKSACQGKKRSPVRKFFRALFTFIFVAGIAAFFFGRHHIREHIKEHPITCVAINGTTTTVQLPLAQFARLGLHPSLTTGESKIVHSEEVSEGTVVISFDLPEDTKLTNDESEAKLFACSMVGPRMTALGVHPKHHGHEHHKKPEHDEHHKERKHHHHHKGPHGPLVKATSLTIKLPASEVGFPRGISFWGGRFPFGMRKFGLGCMHKRIKLAIAKATRVARAEKAAQINAE